MYNGPAASTAAGPKIQSEKSGILIALIGALTLLTWLGRCALILLTLRILLLIGLTTLTHVVLALLAALLIAALLLMSAAMALILLGVLLIS